MEGIHLYEVPALRSPVLVAAFAGWPDAAGAATGAVRYLVRAFQAKRFASVDPEPFFDFSHVRPHISLDAKGERVLTWPSNDFFYHHGERDLILLVGTEPSLRWQSYAQAIIDLARQQGVFLMVTLGALLDAVPHTRDIRVSGASSSPQWRQALEDMGILPSRYEGPTGISGVLLYLCQRLGIPYATIWGHCPHYLQTMMNPVVSLALVRRLAQLLGLEVDLKELSLGALTFEQELGQALAKDPRIARYIGQLERIYDEGMPVVGGFPSPDELMRELEEFLRTQREQPDEE